MFIAMPYCTFKCDMENKCHCCQNSGISTLPKLSVNCGEIIQKYLSNPITNAIVFGGLEPMDSFHDVYEFVQKLRNTHKCKDDIVIYTGYYEHEILDYIEKLKKYENIIIKFGRYIPNDSTHYDDVLGINLASANQYARKIS